MPTSPVPGRDYYVRESTQVRSDRLYIIECARCGYRSEKAGPKGKVLDRFEAHYKAKHN